MSFLSLVRGAEVLSRPEAGEPAGAKGQFGRLPSGGHQNGTGRLRRAGWRFRQERAPPIRNERNGMPGESTDRIACLNSGRHVPAGKPCVGARAWGETRHEKGPRRRAPFRGQTPHDVCSRPRVSSPWRAPRCTRFAAAGRKSDANVFPARSGFDGRPVRDVRHW